MNPLMTRVTLNYQISAGAEIIEHHTVGHPIKRFAARPTYSNISEEGYVFTDDLLRLPRDDYEIRPDVKTDLFAMVSSINSMIPIILRSAYIVSYEVSTEGLDQNVVLQAGMAAFRGTEYYKNFMKERDFDEDLYE